MASAIIKDGVEVFQGDTEICLWMQFLLTELKPEHEWNIMSTDSETSDAAFDPIFFTKSIVRCDLKKDWLVLTLPNISGAEFKEIRVKLKELGFRWRPRLGFWSADYTHERATENYKDRLIDVLSSF